MPYTKSIPEMVTKVIDVLEAQKVSLGVEDIYYGTQDLKPRYPCISVEGGTKRRGVATTRQFEIRLGVTIVIYFGKVQSTQLTTKQTEELAEAIENILHDNKTMDGMVVFGYVTRTDPGVTSVGDDMMVKASRIMWEGVSREVFT